jgi:hypothetical protein
MLPVRPLENPFRLSSYTGSGSACEYTVVKNRKKEKNGKIEVKNRSKLTKKGKNGQKGQK